jgi:cysteine-rich repeat protein
MRRAETRVMFRGVLLLSVGLVAACEPDVEDDSFPPIEVNDPSTPAECVDGEHDEQACPGSEDTYERYCIGGQWRTWSDCPSGECTPGDQESSSCGDIQGSPSVRVSLRTCQADHTWSEWSSCPLECYDWSKPNAQCGANLRGSQTFSCVDGSWVTDGCDDPDECVDGATDTIECEDDLGQAGTETRTCYQGTWLDDLCVVDPARPCEEGEEAEPVSCGLNDRGTRIDVCTDGEWREGSCQDPDVCVDGSMQLQSCGDGAGHEPFVCVGGQYEAAGPCSQVCGDGKVQGTEQCDDTLSPEPNGCSADCKREPVRVLHSAAECGQVPAMLAANWYGAVHWLDNCEQASLFTRSSSGTSVSSEWEYAETIGKLSLSTSIDGTSPILWGSHTAGIPWTIVSQGTFPFVLELDAQLYPAKSYAFSGDARELLALESLGQGRFSLVGSMSGTTFYREVSLSIPNTWFTPEVSLFVIEQKPESATGFAVSSSRALESTKFAAQAESSALLLRNAGGAFELSSGIVRANQVLIVNNAQGRFVATPSLSGGAQSVALLSSGNPVVTGMGGGDYEVQGGVINLPAGPVTLVYNNRAELIGAHPGRFLAETDQGALAVFGEFTGAELTLDRDMLSERKLSSPYGQYNRYVAFYRFSGAVADAHVVASSANQAELTVHLEPRAFARGFVLSIPCSSATRFGEVAGNAMTGDGLCMARFNALAKSMWSHRLTVQAGSELLVGVDRDFTWLSGAITAFDNGWREQQIAVLSLSSSGAIVSDEPIVAIGKGRLNGMVANGGRALLVATFSGSPEVFPGRAWSTSEWGAGKDYLIQIQP